MAIDILHCKLQLSGKQMLFFVDHIVRIGENEDGNAVFYMSDGSVSAINEPIGEVLKTMKQMHSAKTVA